MSASAVPACSGAMNDTPPTAPLRATVGSPISEAIPKSATRTWSPGPTNTLVGWRKRWTMSWSVAASRTSSRRMPRTAARSGSMGPSRWTRWARRGVLDELGDDPGTVAVVDHVDDAGQAGVVDRRHGPGLAAHAGSQRPALHMVERVWEPQFLHGHQALGDQVLGPPEDSHAPLFHRLDEEVAVVHDAAGSDYARHVRRSYPVRPGGGCR